jgi:hypothetical protein
VFIKKKYNSNKEKKNREPSWWFKKHYNPNKSEKPNYFDGRLEGLKHCQIHPPYPSVNLKSPFRKVLH